VPGRKVWLDAKKDRSELRAARVIHRIAEVLAETEALRQDKLEVDKNVAGKVVAVGGSRVCFTLGAAVRWTTWAVDRYSQADRDWMQSFAEAA
jgi:hypothetical protein